MNSLPRPKPGENEDDLLRLQEEFVKQKSLPSATIVNKRKGEQKGVSKFAKTSRKVEKKLIPSAINFVLGEIKEKLPENIEWFSPHVSSNKGFPETFTTKDLERDEGSSIFSQHILHISNKSTTNQCLTAKHILPPDIQENTTSVFGSKSYILTGNDSSEIHQENVEKLKQLTDEEILVEQTKLKESLDPKVLAFVLSRRNSKLTQATSSNMEVDCDQVSKKNPGSQEKEIHIEENSLEVLDSVLNVPKNTSVLNVEGNKWLHMNIVEEEKLHWVGDIPPAEPINVDQHYNARFDFQGLLMPYVSKEVDVRQALYHHGEEPQRPGYSLEELYQLCRSSVLQQRIFALNTIGNILDKVKKGYYDVCFNENLLPKLLDYELFLLLRFSLDENTETQLVATLFALKNLLCSEVDELCLDRAMGCKRSVWQPNLFVTHDIPQNKEQELKETESELKDFEMLKVDIVKGALRTDIIIRIRYILEILRPGPKAVISCLEILTRLARHSYDVTLAITCCPRLLKVIVENFLPKDCSMIVGNLTPSDMPSVYNVPLVEALKLLRIITCHSRKLASDLLYKYSLMNSIISYINVDPRECSLPAKEILRLSLECFYIWQSFLSYNLASSYFKDLYPVLMRLLQFHYHATSLDENSSPFSHEHGTALISLIEQATLVAHYENTHSQPAMRTLDYHHVKDFTTILEMCLSKWLVQLGSVSDLKFSAMKLVGATFNCLNSLYILNFSQATFDLITWMSSFEKMFESRVFPFLKGEGLKKATAQLQNSSCLLFSGELGSKRDPPPLPSLGALMWKGECLTPVLQPKSSIPLIHSLLNFLLASYTLHKGLDLKYLNLLMEDSSFMSYVTLINEKASAKLASHWFTRLEIRLLTSFLKLAFFKGFHLAIVHQLAFKLITLIQKDEKYIIHDVMKGIVFNTDFFKNSLSICEKMESLKIDAFSQNQSSTPSRDLVLKCCNELPNLWACYKKCLNLNENVSVEDYSKITNLTASKKGTELHLPVDWPYLPIMYLQHQEKSEHPVNDETTSLVLASLKWIFLIEELRPGVAVAMTATDRFCRLSAVFLSGSDLFLDPLIHELLSACFKRLMQEYQKIKFLPSFYDMYTQLLEQFAAVSYGDSLFGQFILVPLQQRHSPDLRKQVWSEHAAVLRILNTPVNELMFPVTEMLEPCETDQSLISAYLQCLATGAIQKHWSPVLYLVAVHHVATFINLYSETEFGEYVRQIISKLGNKELQSLLMKYHPVNFLDT